MLLLAAPFVTASCGAPEKPCATYDVASLSAPKELAPSDLPRSFQPGNVQVLYNKTGSFRNDSLTGTLADQGGRYSITAPGLPARDKLAAMVDHIPATVIVHAVANAKQARVLALTSGCLAYPTTGAPEIDLQTAPAT